jgi:hypothetical protein
VSSGILTCDKIDEHPFTILRLVEGLVIHLLLAFVHTSFAHLPFQEGTPLQVETSMVMMHLEIWPCTGVMGLFALTNPMPSFVTQPADIECSLCLLVVSRGTASVSWPSCVVPSFCTALCLTSFRSIVMPSGIFRHSRDVGPIELPLQLP